MKNKHCQGFTLLEILIALFIFTILSIMMTGALRTVINAQSGTETNALRLRDMQMTLIRLSREVEQTVNRPVKTKDGLEDAAFVGTAKGFTFTHGGMAGLSSQQNALQRAEYRWHEKALWRIVWEVLDQAANSPAQSQRQVIDDVVDAKFEYMDDKNKFSANWPSAGVTNQSLPHAIRMSLTIANWGTIRQIYVIPAQNIQQISTPAAK